jgi:hypothetical protein
VAIRAAPHVHGPAYVLCYIVLVCVMFIVCTLLCVLVCVPCIALCTVCLGMVLSLLCALAAPQTIDLVFLPRQNVTTMILIGVGGVFREKNFFKERKSFCLGITILKFIFDFGLRVKKITELQSAIP